MQPPKSPPTDSSTPWHRACDCKCNDDDDGNDGATSQLLTFVGDWRITRRRDRKLANARGRTSHKTQNTRVLFSKL